MESQQVPTKTTQHFPPQLDKRRENILKMFMGQNKDRERSLTIYCNGQKKLYLGKK